MATTLTINGIGYAYPDEGDENWGVAASAWAAAVTSGMLQKAGGAFVLTNEVDFGATFGLKSAYFKSRASNPAATGIFRLGNAQAVSWRNAANSADLALEVDSSNNLLFNGDQVVTAVGALTASRALVTDSGGSIATSSVTSTELGYVSGVTSAIQTQLNAKQASGSYITALTGDVTASGPGSVAASIAATTVTAKVLTGFSSGVGTVSAADSILTAIDKLDGNIALKAPTLKNIANKTTTFNFLTTNYYVNCDTSGGAYTGTLPAASGNSGLSFVVKKTTSDFAALTITDGTLSTTINTQGEVVVVVCDGTNWNVQSRYIPSGTVAWTPTGSWSTNSTYTGYYNRVGNYLNCNVKIALAGAPTSATLTVNTPSGLTIDTSKFNSVPAADGNSIVGELQCRDVGAGSYHGRILYNSTTSVLAVTFNVSGVNVQESGVTQAVPFTFGNTDGLVMNFRVPIVGWNG